jgi:DNA ligase-1
MKAFAALYTALDRTNSIAEKARLLAAYLRDAPAADAAWAVYFLSGHKPRQVISARRIGEIATEAAGIAPWLFEESYDAVGDLAETVAHVLPPAGAEDDAPLAEWVEHRLLPLASLADDERKARLVDAWSRLDWNGRLAWNKLITGGFRVGVSEGLVVRALAQSSGVDADVIAHRLMGPWTPSAEFYGQLTSPRRADAPDSRPYPFFLAHPLEGEPNALGPLADWQAEWKWDGIRAQLVKRNGQAFLWSRGREHVSASFPEIVAAGAHLPDGTVVDGEILAWRDAQPLPFSELQKRLGRKNPGRKSLESAPVTLLAYDLLERNGEDLRARPLAERRTSLEALIGGGRRALALSPLVEANSWEALAPRRAESRRRGVEGLMLKRRASAYGVGRARGDWWKWKIDPYTVDAVLIYAQRGHGRRASLYTDYTFGVWEGDALVPFAKAYSGLDDAEMREVDRFVRAHTREKFGPVRTVEPQLVFELAFEGIQPSPRHKAGIAVRFPRIARWRRDKPVEEADTLEQVKAMLTAEHRHA